MNFSHFLDFLMGLFILIAAIVFLVYYAIRTLSYNSKTRGGSDSISYASKIFLVLYIIYAAITAHINFHYSHEIILSEVTTGLIYLSYLPIWIGGLFLVPYMLIIIFPYYFYARHKYPMLKECKYFPKEMPSLVSIPLFQFLLYRGYRECNAGNVFRLISEFLRVIAICLMTLYFFSILFVVIEAIYAAHQHSAF